MRGSIDAPLRGTALRGATLVGAAVCMFVLTSCTPVPGPAPTGDGGFGVLGAPGCEPPSPILGQEVQGTGSGSVTGYGEFQGVDAASLTEGNPAKLVIRMTGTGALTVDMTAPDGTTRSPDWGPEAHTGSNYDRPGDEWGVGLSFDSPGCWAVNLQRDGDERVTFWLDVAKSA